MNCSAIEYIYLPDSITEIHANAFAGDKSLKYIRLGSHVTFTDNANTAFYNCGTINICVEEDSLTYKNLLDYIKNQSSKSNTNITVLPESAYNENVPTEYRQTEPVTINTNETDITNMSSEQNSTTKSTEISHSSKTTKSTKITFPTAATSKNHGTFPPPPSTKLQIIHNTTTATTAVSPQQTLFGDVNLDGSIDSSDATVILIYYANVLLGEKYPLKCKPSDADVNSDGTIDSSDATVILQYYAAVLLGYNVKLTDF